MTRAYLSKTETYMENDCDILADRPHCRRALPRGWVSAQPGWSTDPPCGML